MFEKDDFDSGGGGSGGEGSSGKEHPDRFVFKTSDETNRLMGELSATSLGQTLENYNRAYSDSIFARDSYTGIDRTSMFIGFDLGIGFWGGKGNVTAGLLVDNITGQLGIQFCVEAGGRLGTTVDFSL